jgi:hypothetical protein
VIVSFGNGGLVSSGFAFPESTVPETAGPGVPAGGVLLSHDARSNETVETMITFHFIPLSPLARALSFAKFAQERVQAPDHD